MPVHDVYGHALVVEDRVDFHGLEVDGAAGMADALPGTSEVIGGLQDCPQVDPEVPRAVARGGGALKRRVLDRVSLMFRFSRSVVRRFRIQPCQNRVRGPVIQANTAANGTRIELAAAHAPAPVELHVHCHGQTVLVGTQRAQVGG